MKKKKIVFIEPYQSVLVYKIAKQFKENGYETILIRFLEPHNSVSKFYAKAYTKIIDLNLNYVKVSRDNLGNLAFIFLKNSPALIKAFTNILFLKPDAVIGKAPLSLPIAFFRKYFFKNVPFIYFPYDIRAHATVSEVIRLTSPMELKAERYCLENSDGILHKGSPSELTVLDGRALGNNIKIPELHHSFPPYCSDEFIIPINKNKISKKGEINLVYIAGTGKKSVEFYYEQFNNLFRRILKQKLHIHVYYATDINTNGNGKDIQNIIDEFYETYKNDPEIKYFHIYHSFPPTEIVKEISKYDYGLTSSEYAPIAGLEPKYNTANKIATYLEAGLAFFSKPEWEFSNSLMEKYNLKLLYPKDMSNFRKVIENIDRKQLDKNIQIAQKDFNIENNFKALEEFIDKVVINKKKQIIKSKN